MINNFAHESQMLGIMISLAGYILGLAARKKVKQINPLLIAILFTIASIYLFRIDYETYSEGSDFLRVLLTPATVCLAIPLYKNMRILKKYIMELLTGVLVSAAVSMGTVYALSRVFSLTYEEYVTFLPKSITTAIGVGVSEKLGGIVSITIASIIITGILGNIFGEHILNALRIKNPVARGLALGASAHAIGTVRAFEMGEVEGAAASLAIAAAGISTAVMASFFAMLY